ncbi:deoxyribodipyrimidine photolyase [Parazoarcus communis]|uniref:Deoxyribodipyrimidine photo-lyase n=1 Tax=Parazoarcus communis TaxID=41977 RepID=A0A2U8H7D9_9RHOO|nr:deoxyribodipyrimidine photo-lyase [Parazoarcus communis]AWI81897.1 deoxyribodipyrimidine photolyase [Parazoarcus communis]
MHAALVWFRRDLRHFDHAALHHALRHADKVYCVFVFDRDILDALLSREDRRVGFIHHAVTELDAALDALARAAGGRGAGLIVRHGRAVEEIPRLARALGVDQVCVNRDYEPAAITRDSKVAEELAAAGISFVDFKDQVIFERDEVLTQGRTPFSVFTPYRNAWMKKLDDFFVRAYPVEKHAGALAPKPAGELVPALDEIGFGPGNLAELRMPLGVTGGRTLFEEFKGRIDRYKRTRDFPAVKGVSYLSTHLRFGTVSIRELVAYAWQHGGEGAETWLSELVWRDFYHMILWHHPRVVETTFKPEYVRVQWDDVPELFAAWCEARTGYPLVDAAMRQLNQTGYMHNRLRMIVASFLTKDLGVDWRLGERYFADHLIDFDLAANNGGWQWAASTGCDAQPYFRIFNPVTQSEKFDPEGRFIRRYLPELERVPNKFVHAPWTMGGIDQTAAGTRIGVDYPAPVVDHASARARTLSRFGVVKAG